MWYILQWVYFRQAKRLKNEQSYRACGIPAVNCKQHRTHLWRFCRSRVGRADSRCDKAMNLYRHRVNLRKILKNEVSLLQSVLIHCRFYATYKYIDISSDSQSLTMHYTSNYRYRKRCTACQIEKKMEKSVVKLIYCEKSYCCIDILSITFAYNQLLFCKEETLIFRKLNIIFIVKFELALFNFLLIYNNTYCKILFQLYIDSQISFSFVVYKKLIRPFTLLRRCFCIQNLKKKGKNLQMCTV